MGHNSYQQLADFQNISETFTSIQSANNIRFILCCQLQLTECIEAHRKIEKGNKMQQGELT